MVPSTATGVPGEGRTGVRTRCPRSTTSSSAASPNGCTATSTIADSASPITRCDSSTILVNTSSQVTCGALIAAHPTQRPRAPDPTSSHDSGPPPHQRNRP
jgi:hypothetical protein